MQLKSVALYGERIAMRFLCAACGAELEAACRFPCTANCTEAADFLQVQVVACTCGHTMAVDVLASIHEVALPLHDEIEQEALRLIQQWHRDIPDTDIRWGPVHFGQVLEYELMERVLPQVYVNAVNRLLCG